MLFIKILMFFSVDVCDERVSDSECNRAALPCLKSEEDKMSYMCGFCDDGFCSIVDNKPFCTKQCTCSDGVAFDGICEAGDDYEYEKCIYR